jgi:hypothetical protein
VVLLVSLSFEPGAFAQQEIRPISAEKLQKAIENNRAEADKKAAQNAKEKSELDATLGMQLGGTAVSDARTAVGAAPAVIESIATEALPSASPTRPAGLLTIAPGASLTPEARKKAEERQNPNQRKRQPEKRQTNHPILENLKHVRRHAMNRKRRPDS